MPTPRERGFVQIIPLISGAVSLPFGFLGLDRRGLVYFGLTVESDANGPSRIRWRRVEQEFTD